MHYTREGSTLGVRKADILEGVQSRAVKKRGQEVGDINSGGGEKKMQTMTECERERKSETEKREEAVKRIRERKMERLSMVRKKVERRDARG